jgi:hypothetical protein
VPKGWKVNILGNLATEYIVTTDMLHQGFEEDIILPWGEVALVSIYR